MSLLDDDEGERRSFGKEVRRHTEYGTSSKPMKTVNTRNCLRHCLVPGDTLQGLSLKYNVPIEHIKRINKLWTNDSIFPRKFLLIPSNAEDGFVDDISISVDYTPTSTLQSAVAKHGHRSRPFDRRLSEGAQFVVNDVDVEVKQDDLFNFSDYFSKIDSKIRVAKENVSKFEERSRNMD